PLARSGLLRDCVRTETQVVQVGRRGYLKHEGVGDPKRGQQPFRLLLRDPKGRERGAEAEIVLDCTGTYGQHAGLGDGGIGAAGETPAEPHIAYGLEDVLGARQAHYAGKTVIVVGAGYSAATTVCDLATLAEVQQATWVVWLARGPSTLPIK